LLAQGKAEQAMTLLEQQYLLKPNNQVITLNYANAAIQGKAYRLAIHLLRNLLYYKTDLFLAYEMLADTYKAMEDFAHYYEARADLYYQLAVYPKAIDDLNEALNHIEKKNTLEIRRIEAKKKQWQAELNRLKRL
jgi:predicted Zn-dependent protease